MQKKSFNNPQNTMQKKSFNNPQESSCEDLKQRLLNYLDTSKMPTLPPIFRHIAKICPPSILPAVMLCLLPILGTLGSRLRFTFSDGKINSPEFLLCLIGDSGSGKSFVTKLRDMLLKQVDAMDEQGRAQEREYQEEMVKYTARGGGKKGSKEDPPEQPAPIVRILEPHTSITKLLRRLDNAQGLHCITIAEEIDEVVDALQRSFSNYTVLLRKSFDNAIYGQDYASKESFSGNVRAMYNVLYSGTPQAVKRLFTDINQENGFTRRFVFTSIPDRTYEAPLKWKQFTPAQQQELDRMLCYLSQSSVKAIVRHDVNGIEQMVYEPCEEHLMEIPWLNRCMDRWEVEVRELARAAGAKYASQCRLRVSNLAARAGALAFYLYGEKNTPRVRRDVCAFAVWVANSMLNGLLAQADDMLVAKKAISHQDIFDMLPEVFSRAQLEALLDGGEDVRHVISKWKNVDHVIDPNLKRGALMIRKIQAIPHEELYGTAAPYVEADAGQVADTDSSESQHEAAQQSAEVQSRVRMPHEQLDLFSDTEQSQTA